MTRALAWESLSDATEALAAHLRQLLITVRTPAGGGSGTAWTDDLAVTNQHVVGDATAVDVALPDGSEARATVAARDPDADLALLRIGRPLSRPAAVQDRPLRTGELVFAMGNPLGEPGALSSGVLAGLADGTEDYLRADVRLAPGNSGGPLATADGRVIGINAMIAGGMAIAIPHWHVQEFVAGAFAPPGFLGISGRAIPLPPGIAASYAPGDGEGLLVTEVFPGSPAYEAGLIPGDVFLRVNGAPGGFRGIARTLSRLRAGKPLTLELLRGGQVASTKVEPVVRV